MELLPRDVIAIVHRYLLRDAYDKVIQQYRAKWLHGNYTGTGSDIFWCDTQQCFKTLWDLVANYRNVRGGHAATIFKFGKQWNSYEPIVWVHERY